MHKIKFIATIVISIIILLIGINYYSKIYSSNVLKNSSIFIPSTANFKDVTTIITPYINNVKSFKWVATKKKYTTKIKAGKYVIKKGMNNNQLVNLLRSGKQTPIRVTFNNQNYLTNLSGVVSKQIEADSLALLKAFKDSTFLIQHHFNLANALSMYLPNTYQFKWNTSAATFRNRMFQEYVKFWNKKRKELATKQNLSPIEVGILASIVQKETAKVSERPMVAQLYLNRLKNHWPLQADPTIIYALKLKKGARKTIKRVLTKDLKIKSPYNSYLNLGLPPGPIAMPDISSINAVLNPAPHNYFYMCASIDKLGYHVFSRTNKEHIRNARKYQNWVDKRGILH